MFRRFVYRRAELRVTDLAAEDGGAEGEAGGRQGDQNDNPGATADPGGAEAEEEKPSDAGKAVDIEEGGGFFGGLFMQFHGDVALVVEGGLDVAGVEAVVGALPGLHDKRGGDICKDAQGEGDREDGVAAGNETGGKDGGEEEGEGDRQVVEHHVKMLGLPEGGDHGTRVGRKGDLFQRKTNG